MAEQGSDAAIRKAFAKQAEGCAKLGSPFTARLCHTIGPRLDRSTEIGRRILDWPTGPDLSDQAVPLRLAGGLHALVRAGRLERLAALYPPSPLPSAEALWDGVSEALVEAEDELLPWLESAPQTNEVARAAVLMAGLLVVAAKTRHKLALYELGASAGLTLILDRYAYRLGTRHVGMPQASVMLAPEWNGGDPPAAELRVADRRGTDLNPLNVTNPADRDRVLAYIWADQADRIARAEAALAIAAADPPTIDGGDAAEWLDQWITREAEPGTTRVVMHSIALQYFPDDAVARITAHLEEVGQAATADAPLAWLRYERDPGAGGSPDLRLRLWPDGSDTVLALADPHGGRVDWRG
jgi:hypothetical protein